MLDFIFKSLDIVDDMSRLASSVRTQSKETGVAWNNFLDLNKGIARINDSSEFKKGTKQCYDAKISIYYHTF